MKNEADIKAGLGKDADPRVDLAVERTLLAAERTQLAWTRTVLSLITSGVAIDKGFTALHEARLLKGEAWARNGHFAGLLLTYGGTILGVFAGVILFLRIRKLNAMMGKGRVFTPGTIMSFFICLVGALAIYFLWQTW